MPHEPLPAKNSTSRQAPRRSLSGFLMPSTWWWTLTAGGPLPLQLEEGFVMFCSMSFGNSNGGALKGCPDCRAGRIQHAQLQRPHANNSTCTQKACPQASWSSSSERNLLMMTSCTCPLLMLTLAKATWHLHTHKGTCTSIFAGRCIHTQQAS